MAKRVVPKELPSKANLQLWEDFLASVRREVNFYKDMSKLNPELFPKVYYSSGNMLLFKCLSNKYWLIIVCNSSFRFCIQRKQKYLSILRNPNSCYFRQIVIICPSSSYDNRRIILFLGLQRMNEWLTAMG